MSKASHPPLRVKGLSAHVRHYSFDLRQHMCEICLETAAQIIQPRLAVGGPDNPVFGTFPPAIRQKRTLSALLREGGAFVPAKLILSL
jgi:hypothetical protein